MMSIFSPFRSATTAFTLSPLIPTHAPTASTFSSFDHTAILDLDPYNEDEYYDEVSEDKDADAASFDIDETVDTNDEE